MAGGAKAMGRWSCVLIAGLLAACGSDPSGPAAANQASGSSDGAVEVGVLNWVGDWAASPALCSGGTWQFREDGVSTAGETSCTIVETMPARSGRKAVTLKLSCTAEGEVSQEEWLLEARPQGVMEVMRAKAGGEIFADVLLSRCPEKGGDGEDGSGNVAQPLGRAVPKSPVNTSHRAF